MAQQIHVTIHPDAYRAKLEQELSEHRSSLRATLSNIEDGSFFEKSKSARPGAVIQFDFGPVATSADEAMSGACNRCFLDVMRSVMTYIDWMIAARRTIGTWMRVPEGISTVGEFQKFFKDYLEQKYQEVSRNTKLTNPKKVQELANLDYYGRDVLLSYFQLRRCLEHHGAVPSEDVTVHYLRFVISAAGNEIKSLPYRAPEDTSIEAHFQRETLRFPKDSKVALTEADIENICLTLQLFIAPNV